MLALSVAADALPHLPDSDRQVLEKLPERAADPSILAMRRLRQQLSQDPLDLALALRLARRYFEQVASEGDPRYIGYAQAALAPWWQQADPPVPVLVLRAVLRQFNHQFDAARADLQSAVRQQPDNGEAWSWLAAIAMVQARYTDAREACAQAAAQASALIAVACGASVDAATGHALAAVSALNAALLRETRAGAAERLWALTRLAETEERLGRHDAAEAAFKRALALGLVDGYLLAAYSDFLLDRQRPAEVLALLKGKERSDLLLLRLTLAAQASGAPNRANWEADLVARFTAASLRGDSLHQKEEARFALTQRGQALRALALARENFAVQREPADARVLLEAAIAAGQPAAAEPVRLWLAESGIESQVLRKLAAQLAAPLKAAQ